MVLTTFNELVDVRSSSLNWKCSAPHLFILFLAARTMKNIITLWSSAVSFFGVRRPRQIIPIVSTRVTRLFAVEFSANHKTVPRFSTRHFYHAHLWLIIGDATGTFSGPRTNPVKPIRSVVGSASMLFMVTYYLCRSKSRDPQLPYQ